MSKTIPFKHAVRIRKGDALLFNDDRDGRRDHSGNRLRYTTEDIDESGAVPVHDIKGVVGRHTTATTEGSSILLAPSFSGFKIQWVEEPACILETCHFIDRTCTDHDLRYLFHFLRMAGALSPTSRHDFVPGTLEDLNSLRMPLYDIDRERVVAERIDAADENHGTLTTALDRMKDLLEEKRRSQTAEAFGLDGATWETIAIQQRP
jgi:hypothetical protein